MPNAHAALSRPHDAPVREREPAAVLATDLSPAHSSPAIDLQRRLGEAALRGFYAAEPSRDSVSRLHVMVAVGSAVASCALVFAAAAALIR